MRQRVRQMRARLRLPRRPERTVARFHRLYYDDMQRTWMRTFWLGTPARKNPLDLWVYQELLVAIQPELVIETGTAFGGSALFFASCMDMIGKGRVLTIDIHETPDRPVHDRITYVLGSSVDPEIVEQARAAAAGGTVMVVLDSDHSRDHVLAELHAYAPLVTEGSYLIVEDTNVNGHPILPTFGPGPHEAVDAFLAEGVPFVRDRECEKLYFTFNPGGFLRREAG